MRFFEFKQTLKKPLVEAARIQHAEDIVFWEGSKGAVRALESLRNLEKGGHTDVTIKWDGSPSIIFGRNEDGEFILTDKSGFVKKDGIERATSAEQLSSLLLNRSGGKNKDDPGRIAFAQNMADIFDEYQKAVPKGFEGYFKGDLLYYNTPPKQDGNFVFKPQLVTYRVKENSELGSKIARSKTGVVVHRIINEQGEERPIDIDLDNFFQGDDVLVFPPVTVQAPAQIDDTKIDQLKAVISKGAASLDSLLDAADLKANKLSDLAQILYTYTNSKVDTGLQGLGEDFFAWLKTSKVSNAKQKKILDRVNAHRSGWQALWDVVNGIMAVKDDIIRQFEEQEADVKASINDQPGGEGFVLAHPEGDIKLVPREFFSRANRAVKR